MLILDFGRHANRSADRLTTGVSSATIRSMIERTFRVLTRSGPSGLLQRSTTGQQGRSG
jgi:hypothetical protein